MTEPAARTANRAGSKPPCRLARVQRTKPSCILTALVANTEFSRQSSRRLPARLGGLVANQSLQRTAALGEMEEPRSSERLSAELGVVLLARGLAACHYILHFV